MPRRIIRSTFINANTGFAPVQHFRGKRPPEIHEIKDRMFPMILDRPRPDDDLNCLRGKTIMVVDDLEINRMVLTKMIKSMGGGTAEAVNGLEALLLVAEGSYDAILMDINMPVLDGVTATRLIRRIDPKPFPILAVTAVYEADEHKAYLSNGIDAVLFKPFTREQFRNFMMTNLL